MSPYDSHQHTPSSRWSPWTDLETASTSPTFTTTERRVLRKLDLTLIPTLWFLLLVSFADRSNIGNAKIAGMSSDLSLTGHKYNIAVMVFTLAYIVFGVPANLVFRRFGPRTLGVMMFIWGLFALAQGLVNTWGGLVACRFLMGVFEAGFVPGCAYLIGSYYKKDEFLKRYAVFFSGAIVAGAVNGLFSYLLAKADGVAGVAGWRWIFLVEGIITSVVAIIVFFIIPAFPEDTNMFKGEEKAVLLERLRQDGIEEDHEEIWKHIFSALLDWKIWLATLAYIGAEENVSSIAAFLPSILKGMGYTSVSAQVHSIPVYCVAFAMTLACAYLSEKLRQRYFFALLGALLTTVGLAIELAQPREIGVKYAGTFVMTAGCYIVMPTVVVWNAINVGKGYKRVVAFAMSTAVGNCGALISSNVFITEEAPTYPTGFAVGMGMNCLCIVALTALYIGLRAENGRKENRELSSEATTEAGLIGEKHPDFRYQL